jgi:hypothetical protein
MNIWENLNNSFDSQLFIAPLIDSIFFFPLPPRPPPPFPPPQAGSGGGGSRVRGGAHILSAH